MARARKISGEELLKVGDGGALVSLWITRAFIARGLSPEKCASIFADEHVGLVVSHMGFANAEEFKGLDWRAFERRALAQMGIYRKAADAADSHFKRNMDFLAARLRLAESEKSLLTFGVLASQYLVLQIVFDRLAAGFNKLQFLELLADTLELDHDEVRKRLAPEAILFSSRLLRLSAPSSSERMVKLLNGFDVMMMEPHDDTAQILAYFFARAPDSVLGSGDLMHLGDRVGILRRYLAGALEQKARGVNILLYGPTGTGKTELARYLAGVTGVPLFEVPVFDQVSGPLDGGERMCAYHTGQELFSDGGAAIMLFDDCEDVFPHEDHPGHGAVKQIGGIKGFRNMILEMNPVPSIWITNSIDHMDPAIVRRFSFHLEVKPPGRETAGKVLGRHLGGLPVGKDFVDRLAGHDVLTPADIESAARVTRIVAPAGGEAAERTLETVLKGRLAARGTGLGMFAESGGTARYSLDYLNTDCDINTLVDGIVQCGEARLLFFGPPGTGKTALAHYIAGKMGRPVVSRKASDILGRYVGETEKHLATMFDEARRARALLLLDEADGFLMDRRGAGQTWEVTQVNELLTQMESYKGVFVCSTNLVENLDQASSRRFDIKVRFRALDADRALDMFLGELDEAGIERPAGPELEQIRRGLGALALLTPGDFTTVRRKARIIGFGKDAAGLLDALRAEVDSKTCCGPKRQVGF